MRPTIKCLSAICASTLLLACADLGNRAPASGTAVRAADAAYVDARGHHLAGRLEEAEAAYRGALAADPAHVNARNGLASLYAEKGDFTRAIPIWQALTEQRSLGSGPGSAFLFNNLGYAYLLAGDYDKAVGALEKACLLDPLNHRSWLHLGHALYKLGQDARARQMFSQANALQEHDLRSDYTVTGGSPAPAIEAAARVPPPREEEWAAHDVVVGSAGILELRRVPAAQAPAAASTQAREEPRPEVAPALPGPAPVPQDAPTLALLEIRNGNGVTGMARGLSHQMGDPALKVVRLSNEKRFNVRQTRVEYVGPFRDAAERLAQRFGGAQAVQVESIRAADMRLVIGRDLVKARFTLRPPAAPEPRLADAG
jgi:tetratricopeptide (TPR) repeat protein